MYMFVYTYIYIWGTHPHTHTRACNFLLRSSWNEIQKTFFSFVWWKLQFSSYFSLNFHAKRKKLFALLLLPFVRSSFADVLSPLVTIQIRTHTRTTSMWVSWCPFSWQVLFLINARSTYSPFRSQPKTETQTQAGDFESWQSFLELTHMPVRLCVSNWKDKEQDEPSSLKTQPKLK